MALTASLKGGEFVAFGCNLKIISVIDDPSVIERILTHLGLAARRFDLFQAA